MAAGWQIQKRGCRNSERGECERRLGRYVFDENQFFAGYRVVDIGQNQPPRAQPHQKLSGRAPGGRAPPFGNAGVIGKGGFASDALKTRPSANSGAAMDRLADHGHLPTCRDQQRPASNTKTRGAASPYQATSFQAFTSLRQYSDSREYNRNLAQDK